MLNYRLDEMFKEITIDSVLHDQENKWGKMAYLNQQLDFLEVIVELFSRQVHKDDHDILQALSELFRLTKFIKFRLRIQAASLKQMFVFLKIKLGNLHHFNRKNYI